MDKKIKMRYPLYLSEFKCIGGICEDSCCIGWDVDIDKTSFRKYYKVKNIEMKRLFQKNIHFNDNYFSEDVDYGRVKLKGGKRCPFLDSENYCMIYSNLGQDYLSNVCTSFPRTTNIVDGIYEMSLDVACPEASRIILLKEEGIQFKENEVTLGKHIVSGEIDTKSKQANKSPLKYFNQIRELCIRIIKNRKLELSQRFYILGDFIENLEEELEYNYGNVLKFIKQYDINSPASYYNKNKLNFIIQVEFLKNMMNVSDLLKKIDSPSYREYTGGIIGAYQTDQNKYVQAFEDYTQNFIESNNYIFENYLVNFMYNYLFPFSETKSIFDGYIMLLFRYSFIRFFLVGRYLNNKQESKENIVKFIQAFTKNIEHNKTYLVDVLNYIKENEFDNIEFAKTLL